MSTVSPMAEAGHVRTRGEYLKLPFLPTTFTST